MTVALATVALVAVALGALLRILTTLADQPVGRHRGDLTARLLTQHRVRQIERELGWGDQ